MAEQPLSFDISKPEVQAAILVAASHLMGPMPSALKEHEHLTYARELVKIARHVRDVLAVEGGELGQT
jgi:hypothetical protein